MRAFDELMHVAEKLNSPEGCPWDQKQTFKSLQPYVIEEAHEVVDAVDKEDDQKIIEELGDLLYTIIFYAKIAEKEKRFKIEDILNTVREKLIRRHPHVFGEQKVHTAEEVIHRWEAIKKSEESHVDRKSLLDGIPATLPVMVRAQKVIKKIFRTKSPLFSEREKHLAPRSESDLGKELLALIIQAEDSGIDAESALRRTVHHLEEDFREWEKKLS